MICKMKQQILNLSAKDLQGKSGIYFITCFGHQYVGSSKSLYSRLREHKIKLLGGNHSNDFMQKAFNKYGIDNFYFEILEYCSSEERIEREKFYIDSLKPDMNLQLDPVLKTLSQYSRQKLGKSVKDGRLQGKYKTKFDFCEIEQYDYFGNYMLSYTNKEDCSKKLGISKKAVQKLASGYPKGLSHKGIRLRYKSSKIAPKKFDINPNYLGKHFNFFVVKNGKEYPAFTNVKDVWSFFAEQIMNQEKEVVITFKIKTN
jgi:hypothetical protein